MTEPETDEQHLARLEAMWCAQNILAQLERMSD
jgi:hypothetical protein